MPMTTRAAASADSEHTCGGRSDRERGMAARQPTAGCKDAASTSAMGALPRGGERRFHVQPVRGGVDADAVGQQPTLRRDTRNGRPWVVVGDGRSVFSMPARQTSRIGRTGTSDGREKHPRRAAPAIHGRTPPCRPPVTAPVPTTPET